MDGGAAVAMDLQAELLGELLGGVGRSIHGGSLPCGAGSVMRGGGLEAEVPFDAAVDFLQERGSSVWPGIALKRAGCAGEVPSAPWNPRMKRMPASVM
jgi:hypothetical protein